jgi:O-acetyl-ADP-ribose deacetylase (regulator of RNase III)
VVSRSKCRVASEPAEALVSEVRSRNIRSIAVPPLGCGLGGLEWPAVRPLIEAAFAELPDVRVRVCEPAPAAVVQTRR